MQVLNEYDKHNEENPKHHKYDKAGEKLEELDDMEVATTLLSSLGTDHITTLPIQLVSRHLEWVPIVVIV